MDANLRSPRQSSYPSQYSNIIVVTSSTTSKSRFLGCRYLDWLSSPISRTNCFLGSFVPSRMSVCNVQAFLPPLPYGFLPIMFLRAFLPLSTRDPCSSRPSQAFAPRTSCSFDKSYRLVPHYLPSEGTLIKRLFFEALCETDSPNACQSSWLETPNTRDR